MTKCGMICVPVMWWIVGVQTSDEILYVLCICNVVDSWCARLVMKYGIFCVLVMWWIVGVPDM